MFSAQKILVTALAAFIGLFSFVKLTFAQTQLPQTNSISIPIVQQNVSPQSPQYANLMLLNLIHGLTCIAGGVSPIQQPCLEAPFIQDFQRYLPSETMLPNQEHSGGLLGLTLSLLTAVYLTPPLNTNEYLTEVVKGFGIIPEAHAQVGGSGATVLNPILPLWQLSRNIAYLFMIIIFMVVGLMVMFRRKINPQTVLTVQAALPSLVIGLVLITFSYFIAALLTDLAFVGLDLVGFYFQIAQGQTGTVSLSQSIANRNVLNLYSPFVGVISWRDIQLALDIAWDGIRGSSGWTTPLLGSTAFTAEFFIRTFVAFASYQFGVTFGPAVSQLAAGAACAIPAGFTGVGIVAAFSGCATLGKLFGTVVVPPALLALGFLNPPFVAAFPAAFIVIFIMLYAMGKLLLRLINCYLAIIFYTITGPFHLLAASLPGRREIAVNWMRNILCNVLAFPAVGAVIYFAGYLLNSTHLPVNSGELNVFGAGSTLPLFGGLSLSFLKIMLAFGALVAVPAVPDILCKAIGKPGAGGDLLGREIQGSIGQGQRYSKEWNEGLNKTAGDLASYKSKLFGKVDHGGGLFDELHRKTEEEDRIHGGRTSFMSPLARRLAHWAGTGETKYGGKDYRSRHKETTPTKVDVTKGQHYK